MRHTGGDRGSIEHDEVPGIGRHEAAPLEDRPVELLTICQLCVPQLVRAHRIDPPASEHLSEARGEILVEVEPHRRRVVVAENDFPAL